MGFCFWCVGVASKEQPQGEHHRNCKCGGEQLACHSSPNGFHTKEALPPGGHQKGGTGDCDEEAVALVGQPRPICEEGSINLPPGQDQAQDSNDCSVGSKCLHAPHRGESPQRALGLQPCIEHSRHCCMPWPPWPTNSDGLPLDAQPPKFATAQCMWHAA